VTTRPGARGRVALGLLLVGLLPVVWWSGSFLHPPRGAPGLGGINFVNWDVYRYFWPGLQAHFDAIGEGRLRLWDPYRAAGAPFLGSSLMGLLYPGNLALAFLPAALALGLGAALHLAFAAAGTFVCVRRRGAPVAGAALGALAFAFSSFLVLGVWQPSQLQACAWLPWVLLAADRLRERGRARDVVLLALALAAQILTGFAQGVVYVLYALPFWVLLPRERPAARPRAATLALLAVSVGFAAGVTAFHWLPGLEASRLSVRPPGGLSLEESEPARLPASRVLGDFVAAGPRVPDPRTLGDWYFGGQSYFGIAPLLAALAAALGRRRETALLAGLFAGGTLLALGSATPAFRLVHAVVPGGDWFRHPGRFLALAIFAGAALAGIGAGDLARGDRGAAARLGLAGLAGAGALGALGLWSGAALAAVVALAGGLGWARPAWGGLGAAGLLVVTGADLFVRNRNWIAHPQGEPAPLRAFAGARGFLERGQGDQRVYLQADGWMGVVLSPRIGAVDGLNVVNEYEPLTLSRYAEYTKFAAGGGPEAEARRGFASTEPLLLTRRLRVRLLDLLSVRLYALDPESEAARGLEQAGGRAGIRKVYEDGEAVVFENPGAFPRAFFVPRARVVRDGSEALRLLVDPAFDPRREVVLEGEPGAAGGAGGAPEAGGEVVRASFGESRHEVEVRADAPGFLVVTDTWFPGWTVSVDGGPEQPPLRANHLVRAVPVPVGRSRVVFVYRPRAFLAGLWVAAATLALGLVGKWCHSSFPRRK